MLDYFNMAAVASVYLYEKCQNLCHRNEKKMNRLFIEKWNFIWKDKSLEGTY